MSEFYSKVFGWKLQHLGPEMGEYVLAQTTDVDSQQRPVKAGAINGGFYQRTDDPLSKVPSVVIQVENVAEAMKKVKGAGGKILGDPQDIPGVGKWVSFLDTEGNRVSMIQSSRP